MSHDIEDKIPQAVREGIPSSFREKADQAKQHLQDNTKTYLVGAVCFAAGYLIRKNPDVTMILNDVKPHITPVLVVDKLPTP